MSQASIIYHRLLSLRYLLQSYDTFTTDDAVKNDQLHQLLLVEVLANVMFMTRKQRCDVILKISPVVSPLCCKLQYSSHEKDEARRERVPIASLPMGSDTTVRDSNDGKSRICPICIKPRMNFTVILASFRDMITQ